MKEKDYTITIKAYLIKYYGFPKEVAENITHKQLQALLDIKPVKNQKRTNENIAKGKILKVKDTQNNIAYYTNPFAVNYEKQLEIIKENQKIQLETCNDKTTKRKEKLTKEKIRSLKTYNLLLELENLKLEKDYHTTRLIIKELKLRPKSHKKEKQEKVRKKEFRKEVYNGKY